MLKLLYWVVHKNCEAAEVSDSEASLSVHSLNSSWEPWVDVERMTMFRRPARWCSSHGTVLKCLGTGQTALLPPYLTKQPCTLRMSW